MDVQNSYARSSAPDPPPERRTVLVIDDDPWIRSVIAQLLNCKGYAVEQAADGATGLRMVELIQPDVILLDLALPMRSGLEVLLRLKEHQPTRELPVTIVSAYAMLLVPDVGGRADRLRHMPFDLKELLGHVAQMVGQAHPDFHVSRPGQEMSSHPGR